MVQLIFYIRFPSQLRRVRPALFDSFENTISRSIEVSGGKIRHSFHSIVADFDANAIGFWIDILTMLESINATVEKKKHEFFGCLCVLSENVDDDFIPLLFRTLPAEAKASGIWCSPGVRDRLQSFANFTGEYISLSVESSSDTFSEIERIKLSGAADNTPAQAKRAVPDSTTLTIRFGSGASALCCFIDAFTPAIHELLADAGIKTTRPTLSKAKGEPAYSGINEELLALHQQLFKDRLRSESTPWLLRLGRRFFFLLLNSYCHARAAKGRKPIIILEDMQKADANLSRIFVDVYTDIAKDSPPPLYALCSSENIPSEFKGISPYMIFRPPEPMPSFSAYNADLSLWELAQTCYLFGKYFPPSSFIELFSAEGKNRDVAQKALALLLDNNIIRSIDYPVPALPGFTEGVEQALGERSVYIRSMVRKRLLSWVGEGKINPCYNLLEALHSLGAVISDSLVLEALKSDLVNGAFRDIELAISEGRFNHVVGEGRAPALSYCWVTLKALLFGSEEHIMEVFKITEKIDSDIPLYKSSILTIEAIFSMMTRNVEGALGAIKKSIMILQKTKEKKEIAQVYRVFSLVNLSKKELSDTLEYIAFAVEEAEHSKNYEELAISAYYAAAVHFIFGNLSKSEHLIKQSEHYSQVSGRFEWALRARFFLARLHFEIGSYKTALSIFKSLVGSEAASNQAVFSATLNAWIFRTELYLDESMPELPAVLNTDGLMFKLESLYLSGEYDKAIALSEEVLRNLPTHNSLMLEQPDWESGFAQCEMLVWTPEEFWKRSFTVWRALALCKAGEHTIRDAVAVMRGVMRDELLWEYDPGAPFIFFANYLVLNEAKASEIDKNTAISVAFKRLQSRAVRINDIEIRRAFLSRQYWNAILFDMAKEHNLISKEAKVPTRDTMRGIPVFHPIM
ncbi:MAG: hypothetical protein LBT01_02540 [Spirochaetaceae bacterium]|jgi:tetratricopeptide (TPR) repeat protein|nr:hypothetical protein [Spirochaetaceae bacterium]